MDSLACMCLLPPALKSTLCDSRDCLFPVLFFFFKTQDGVWKVALLGKHSVNGKMTVTSPFEILNIFKHQKPLGGARCQARKAVRGPQFSSVQSLSCVQLFMTPRTAARQASLSFTNSQSLLKLMSIESVMPSNDLILCHPLLLLPSIFPGIRVFSNESALCIRWPKYWNFSFSVHPSNEYSGLISFRMDWLDLLAVQGTLKSLLQHHSPKASILQCSAFFMVQLSHPYMTTETTIALTRWTFVGEVMSLLFNLLSRLVIAFL